MSSPASRPRVSVCTPTYNYGRYLGTAIRSVQAQTFTDWEMVIADNGSTDGTADIVAELADPRVRYCRYAETVPMIDNFNRCLDRARGELILFLCADDALTPAMLGLLVDALDRQPGAGLAVACLQQDVDDEGRTIGPPRRHLLGPGLIAGRDVLLALCRHVITVGLPSQVLFRASALLDAGRMDPRAHQAADNDLFCRILERSDAVYVAGAMFLCRWHDEMQTVLNRRSLEGIRSDAYVFARLFRESRVLSASRRHRLTFVRHRLFPWFRRAVEEARAGRFDRSLWIVARIAAFSPVPWWLPYYAYLYARDVARNGSVRSRPRDPRSPAAAR